MNPVVARACQRCGPVLAVLVCFPVHAADYIDLRTAAAIHGDASAGAGKAGVCIACHGPGGNPLVPTFPRLAGQRADYLYWHLVEYKRGHVPESPMTAQVANLSDEDMRDLAAFFTAQKPQTPENAPPVVTDARGGELYANGDPARGVPPCQGCHGADATGQADPRFRMFPILRGQHADYVIAKLKEYRSGALADSTNDFIMQGVARTLDDASIEAIARWLAALPPEKLR
jgi:cytochrome c553